MEDNVKNDRFYEKHEATREMVEKIEEAIKELNPPKEKSYEMMEFAPEPIHVRESSRAGTFTVGNKYPIFERDDKINKFASCSSNGSTFFGNCYKFKTTDDKGQEVWVDDKFFIPAETVLTYEAAFQSESPIDFAWIGEDGVIKTDCPNIRVMAEEKGVSNEIGNWFGEKDANVLSGLTESDEEKETFSESRWKQEPFWNTTLKGKKSYWSAYNPSEGVVKDDGNDLMYNADKCMAAISKVFGSNEVVDPDDIISSIRELFTHHTLTWQEGFLAVNDAVTKIDYKSVQKAYVGLKALVPANVAEKTVSKLIARKLHKLF